MFVTSKIRSLQEPVIDTFIDDDKVYPVVTNFKIGASSFTVYWTKEQYAYFITEGQQNLQELDSLGVK